MSLTIRPATTTDATAIGTIQVLAWQQRLSQWAPAWFIQQFNATTQAQKYAERLADPAQIVLVAESNDVVIGFASLKTNTSEPREYSHQIGALYTHPQHEKQGAGTALLSTLLEAATDQNITNAIVWTFRDNTPARNIYQACGGTLLPFTECTDMDLNIPHVCYGWHLTPTRSSSHPVTR